ncbi:hypothetical protein AB0M28_17805 [Streptomyces sp. NPDC051940]|uniref:PepSY domain-containing protein n=1 Tax=Streptomyces sp. NPDC051940 TaxID=3155675 RepID=UPI0034317CCB
MTRRVKWIVTASIAVALAGTGAGIAMAGAAGDDDGREVPITGAALERASAAALAHTGGGSVTGTETGDEEGYYEVEVTLADGTRTDVHLDQNFKVLGDEQDGADDTDGGEG